MAFVVDASVAAPWFLPDENSSLADKVMARLAHSSVHVPALFWVETLNILVTARRRGRIASGIAEKSIADLRRLPLIEHHEIDEQLVIFLADRHRLSAYDATYLALAKGLALPLVTADHRLLTASEVEALPQPSI